MLEPPCRGGSNEYPQSMFWSKNKKNKHTPEYPFCYIKVGFEGVHISQTYFPVGPAQTILVTGQSVFVCKYQRTNGPENAHLKPDPGVLSHHEMTLTLNTHTPLLNS